MISWRRFELVTLFALTISSAYGYVFECLDDCLCNTDDEAIHCHNNQERKVLRLPKNRLRGFSVLGLTRNNITVLPSQDLLLEILPDLEVVDVELNPNFECSTLEQYKKIRVLSSCGKSPEEISELANITTIVENEGKPTSDCDMSCQTKRHYDKLHLYLEHLWKVIQEKFGDLTRKHRVLQDMKEFFIDVGERVAHMAKQLKDVVADEKSIKNITSKPSNEK